MARRINLQDRQGNQLLPLTRSELVQFTEITGLNAANLSVQAALEALYTYIDTVNQAQITDNAALSALNDKLKSFAQVEDSVKKYVNEQDTAYLALAYARSAAEAAAAQANSYAKAESEAAVAQANSYAKANEVKDLAYAKAEIEGTAAKNYADGKFLSNVKLNNSFLTVASDETNGRYVDLGSIATSDSLQSLTNKVEAIEAAYATSASVTDLRTAYENGYTALQTRIAANESAITTLNGSAQTQGSVAYQVAEGIAGVVAGADADFDTLKEVADWIKSDTTGAAAMQTAISTLNGADTVTGSVAKQVKDSYTAMESHTVNGKALSTNPVLDASDITYTGNTTVADAIEDLYSQVGEGGSVSTQIENAINALDGSYTASGTVAYSGTYVMNAVTQTDGKIVSIGSVEVEAAGAAAAVQTALTGDATTYTNLGLVEDEIESIRSAISGVDGDSVKTVNGQSPTNGAVTVDASQIDTVTTFKIGSDSAAAVHTVDEVLAAGVYYIDTTGSGTYANTTI